MLVGAIGLELIRKGVTPVSELLCVVGSDICHRIASHQDETLASWF